VWETVSTNGHKRIEWVNVFEMTDRLNFGSHKVI
jgi:hypothetical protein